MDIFLTENNTKQKKHESRPFHEYHQCKSQPRDEAAREAYTSPAEGVTQRRAEYRWEVEHEIVQVEYPGGGGGGQTHLSELLAEHDAER